MDGVNKTSVLGVARCHYNTVIVTLRDPEWIWVLDRFLV